MNQFKYKLLKYLFNEYQLKIHQILNSRKKILQLFSQIIIIFFIFTFRVYLRSQASPWVKVHRPSLLHPLQHLVVVQQSALHHRRPSWGKFWHWSVGGSLTRSTKGKRSSKQILQWIEYTSYPNTGGLWYMQTFYLQVCICAIENMAF
jgi:hypothetical protein